MWNEKENIQSIPNDSLFNSTYQQGIIYYQCKEYNLATSVFKLALDYACNKNQKAKVIEYLKLLANSTAKFKNPELHSKKKRKTSLNMSLEEIKNNVYAGENLTDTIQHLTSLITTCPKNAEANYLLSLAYEKNQDLTNAINYANYAAEYDESCFYQKRCGDLYSLQADSCKDSDKANLYFKALSFYNKINLQDLDSSVACQIEQAVKKIKANLSAIQPSATWQNFKKSVSGNVPNVELSIKPIESEMPREPYDFKTLLYFAQMHFANNHLEKAIDYAWCAIQKEKLPIGYFTLAKYQLIAAMVEKDGIKANTLLQGAWNDCSIAIMKDSSKFEYYEIRAEICKRKKEFIEAKKDLETALKFKLEDTARYRLLKEKIKIEKKILKTATHENQPVPIQTTSTNNTHTYLISQLNLSSPLNSPTAKALPSKQEEVQVSKSGNTNKKARQSHSKVEDWIASVIADPVAEESINYSTNLPNSK